MRRNRTIWPGHATVHEAVQYLASVCDGAIKRDGDGFCSDHVAYGHWLAQLPPAEWGPEERRHGLTIVRTYSRNSAGRGLIRSRSCVVAGLPESATSAPADCRRVGQPIRPASLSSRWWNGVRWTAETA